MITDISAELEREFGKPGTPERDRFDEKAYAFYTGQILKEAGKDLATGNSSRKNNNYRQLAEQISANSPNKTSPTRRIKLRQLAEL